MSTTSALKNPMKFNCIYCGQHMECDSHLAGRQILCPACLHRLVIPTTRGGGPARQTLCIPQAWDTHVPSPDIEIPTRYRGLRVLNPVLAQAA